METFLVGGAVRDTLMGMEPKDRDWVVVGGTSQDMIDKGFTRVGADFAVFICPDTKDEFALARTEVKSCAGHVGFQCDFDGITLEEDLMRRDLTINAMAMTDDGVIVDPFGGQADLETKVLRHVSPAFAEDPLRVLRVARFAARFEGFTVHEDTLAMMATLVDSGELDTLTPERVWKEMSRALGEANPAQFFRVLHSVGALEVILPELTALSGVPQPAQHHPEVDTFVHVMLCLEQAVQMGFDTDVRFAVLLHDLGKGITPTDMLPQHIGHEEAGAPLVEAVCARLKVPKHFKTLAVLVCRHHLRCHKALDMRPGKVFKLLKVLDGFRRPDLVIKFTQACEADARGRTGLEDREYKQAAHVRSALIAAKSVSGKPLVERGFEGLKLAALLDQERIRAIINM